MTRTRPVHRFLTAFAVMAAATGILAGGAGASSSSQKSQKKKTYIVVLEDGVRPGKAAKAHAKRHGLKIGHVYRSALRGYSAVVPPGKLRKLRKDVRVDYVVRDMLVTGVADPGVPADPGQPASQGGEARDQGIARMPEDPANAPEDAAQGVDGAADDAEVEGSGKGDGGGGKGGGAPTTDQTVPTGVDRIDAELSSALSGDGSGEVGVGVAVLDTGSGPHSDLNVAGATNCVPKTRGTADLQGHGTHVAGIIAARDDGTGVVGVAPGAPIYSVRVLGTSITGTTESLLCGLDWLAANGAALGIRVANLSLEQTRTNGAADLDDDCGGSIGDPVHEAVCAVIAQGITVVAAGGNHATELSGTVPAAYDDVFAVTAIADFDGQPGGLGVNPNACEADEDDSSASFSNWASDTGSDMDHTVAAPGRCLNSTWKGGGYNLQSGTSFAAPHVAGVVALCIESGTCARLSPSRTIDRIQADANAVLGSYGFTDDPTTPLAGRWYGPLVTADAY